VRFVDTVCKPTKERQSAAVEMAREADVVIVVGGRSSNNTRELVKTCARITATSACITCRPTQTSARMVRCREGRGADGRHIDAGRRHRPRGGARRRTIVVSRGCPHVCDFCYKDAFFEGGRSFYTQPVDAALAEIDRLPGRHLYFLDDHLFGNRRFASALFDGMRGMGRLWQAAGTVNAVLAPGLLEQAVECGLRSLFVGFETLNEANLVEQHKYQNLHRDYAAAIRRLHDLGVMINGSFVFGLDADDSSVFDRTVEWAVRHGIETATFHVLTPYPGTALHNRLASRGRIFCHDWDRYDTRHAVFQPARMSGPELERGYRHAYREFYRWGSLLRGATAHDSAFAGLRHLAYAAGWKKFEPAWDLVIRAKRAGMMLPALETILSEFGRLPSPGRTSGRARETVKLEHGRDPGVGTSYAGRMLLHGGADASESGGVRCRRG
jgi:radical SAM superfamily enzyme YgiQ (UPF0313 family)